MKKTKSISKTEVVQILNNYVLNEPDKDKIQRFQKMVISNKYCQTLEGAKALVKSYTS